MKIDIMRRNRGRRSAKMKMMENDKTTMNNMMNMQKYAIMKTKQTNMET